MLPAQNAPCGSHAPSFIRSSGWLTSAGPTGTTAPVASSTNANPDRLAATRRPDAVRAIAVIVSERPIEFTVPVSGWCRWSRRPSMSTHSTCPVAGHQTGDSPSVQVTPPIWSAMRWRVMPELI
jgi:hypothetical protein